MKLGIMQPYFMPYIGYFQLICAVDLFVVYDDVNYIKKGWINRNNLLVNDQKKMFNIPLKKVSQNKYINEIEIDNESNWKQNLLKTIGFSYKKAPFYQDVYQVLETIILNEENNLSKFNLNSLREVCRYLSIKTEIIQSSDLEKNNELKGQYKIIKICNILNADKYINAIGGIDLYDRQSFLDNGINLRFIKPKSIIYAQFKNDFLPWLSIIDVMMFNSREEISQLLTRYELE